MNREPHRTNYIDTLYKEKNIEWLEQELDSIKCIILWYSTMILETLTNIDEEKYIKRIKNEKEMKQKIEKYLDILTNKNEL